MFLYHEREFLSFIVLSTKIVMAAKKVASVLHVLTSDGLSGCDEWADNNAFEALVAEYFTGSGDDALTNLTMTTLVFP